jgi:hypothetical protein
MLTRIQRGRANRHLIARRMANTSQVGRSPSIKAHVAPHLFPASKQVVTAFLASYCKHCLIADCHSDKNLLAATIEKAFTSASETGVLLTSSHHLLCVTAIFRDRS